MGQRSAKGEGQHLAKGWVKLGANDQRGLSLVGNVDLHGLHRATGVSHPDGFTFKPEDTMFNEEQLAKTIEKFRAKADPNGHLTFQDIVAVKEEIARESGVDEISNPSLIENKLLFAILDGVERKVVDLDDVISFVHGEVPKHLGAEITKEVLDSIE